MIAVFLGAALVNNLVLSRFLGVCPLLGTSRSIKTALGMSMAVMFVMVLSSAITFWVYNSLLVSFGLEYMYTIVFILIIASLVQAVEMFIKKKSQALHKALGVYLPLITTNCAVLGVAVLNIRQEGFTLLYAVIHGFGGAVGFSLALVLFASIREKVEGGEIPAPFRGFPIALVAAGLMSVVFLGFRGML
jgi:electron transport complex protein RnfA